LGYSLYDTVIVFDRIRENMPRMPRAAFSQIVNRSMSEVLTRSLVAGLSTILGVISLLIFGGATLQDFAFAMLIGIASGTYSSIFIASPVLTAWKEREPGYARRREQIARVDGTVPAFADDVAMARVGDEAEGEEAAAEGAAAPERTARPAAGAVATAEPQGEDGSDGPGPSSNGEKAAAEQASAERRARNAARRERRQQRRKHGRNR
jgi:SecD/SecF fusion protein